MRFRGNCLSPKRHKILFYDFKLKDQDFGDIQGPFQGRKVGLPFCNLAGCNGKLRVMFHPEG